VEGGIADNFSSYLRSEGVVIGEDEEGVQEVTDDLDWEVYRVQRRDRVLEEEE